MKNIIKVSLAVSFALFVSGCGGSIIQLAERSLYPFAEVDKNHPVSEIPPEGFDQVYLDVEASDGSDMRVHTWFHKASNPGSRLLFYVHGNGENLEAVRKSNLLRLLASWGYHVVVFDFPGLGRSTGFPDEANLVNAGLAVLDWAHETFPQAPVMVWGRSLGAAVAAQVVAKTDVKVGGLMLTSPWATFLELAKDKTKLAGSLPEEWIEKHKYDTVSAVADISVRTTIHHGNKDTLIPFKFGKKVHAAFPEGVANFTELTGFAHNDVFQSQQLFTDLRSFPLQQ